MTLDEIELEWSKDCKITLDKLTEKSMAIPELHAKYHKILNKELIIKRKLDSELIQIEEYVERYYSRKLTDEELSEYGFGEFPDYKVLKPDIPKKVAIYPDVVKHKNLIGLQIIKIDYLRSIIKEVSAMSFQIRNAIEHERFRAGEY